MARDRVKRRPNYTWTGPGRFRDDMDNQHRGYKVADLKMPLSGSFVPTC